MRKGIIFLGSGGVFGIIKTLAIAKGKCWLSMFVLEFLRFGFFRNFCERAFLERKISLLRGTQPIFPNPVAKPERL